MIDNQGHNVGDRIAQLIENGGYTSNSFAQKIGVASTVIYNIVSGRKSKPSFDVLEKILESNDAIRTDWLIKGEGEMFKSSKEEALEPMKGDSEDEKETGVSIPLYNALASAGGGALILSNEYIIDQIKVPFARREDSALQVVGDSMAPVVHSGDMAVVRDMKNWREYLEFGKMYIIVTEDDVYCKVIKRHADPSRFILHSYNKSYDDFDVPISFIRFVYKVVGVVAQHSY